MRSGQHQGHEHRHKEGVRLSPPLQYQQEGEGYTSSCMYAVIMPNHRDNSLLYINLDTILKSRIITYATCAQLPWIGANHTSRAEIDKVFSGKFHFGHMSQI